MATIKLLFLCFFILTVTVKFTSCQGQSNGTQVTTTEKPDDDETTETTEANDESDAENETESESGSENEDSEYETTEKPKKSEESESEKPESKKKSDEKKEKPEKEDEIDLEDDPVPEPRCLARYNNLNCTEAQRQSAISNYKVTRGQLIQTLLQSGSSPSGSNNTTGNNNATVSIISVPSNINSTQVYNIVSSPSLNSTASSSSSSSSSSITTTVSSISSGISSCNRAVQLLANVDKYVRFNDSCSARVFGKRNNPDYWISRCMKSLRRHH